MRILKHCYNEYYITMPDNSDLDSFEDGLQNLVEDDEDGNNNGIISDFDFNYGETEADVILGDTPDVKEVHIYLSVDHDSRKGWRRIGKAINMSPGDLAHTKSLASKTYKVQMDKVPENSLWDEPWPDAKPVKDFDGSMVELSRMDQLREDTPQFLGFDYGEEILLFYLAGDKDTTELLQKIEDLLLLTDPKCRRNKS